MGTELKYLMLSKKMLLDEISSLENPTINTLSVATKCQRPYVSFLLNILAVEGIVEFKMIGSTKVWRMKK
jgi:hypothetical protein